MRQFIVVSFVLFSLSNAFADDGKNPSCAPQTCEPVKPVPAKMETATPGKGAHRKTANTTPEASSNAQPVCSQQDEFATVPPPSIIEKGKPPYPYPYYLELGKFVTLKVPHDKYAAYFAKRDDNVQPTPVLYINNFAVQGLTAISSGCEDFSFFLTRTDSSRDLWGNELRKLDGKDNVPVGIGTVQSGFVTDIGLAELKLTGQISMTWWYLLMAVLICAIFWMGACTGLLRDLPVRPAAGATDWEPITAVKRPFSLARVQMAFWFTLAMGAYVYIWIKTGDIANVIPDSILTLMGLSAGTTVLSAVVDTSVPPQPQLTASGTFIKDILSDNDGISFHRLQMLMWTIVLGFVFVKKVSATWIMPDFDAQLLGLMGVGSATYLGFKIPAAQAAANSTGSQAPAGPDKHPPAVG